MEELSDFDLNEYLNSSSYDRDLVNLLGNANKLIASIRLFTKYSKTGIPDNLYWDCNIVEEGIQIMGVKLDPSEMDCQIMRNWERMINYHFEDNLKGIDVLDNRELHQLHGLFREALNSQVRVYEELGVVRIVFHVPHPELVYNITS